TRVGVLVARRLRIALGAPDDERKLRDHRGRALVFVPDLVAAVALVVQVDALDAGRGAGALLGGGEATVAVVVLGDERAAGPNQRLVGRACAGREHGLHADAARASAGLR